MRGQHPDLRTLILPAQILQKKTTRFTHCSIRNFTNKRMRISSCSNRCMVWHTDPRALVNGVEGTLRSRGRRLFSTRTTGEGDGEGAGERPAASPSGGLATATGSGSAAPTAAATPASVISFAWAGWGDSRAGGRCSSGGSCGGRRGGETGPASSWEKYTTEARASPAAAAAAGWWGPRGGWASGCAGCPWWARRGRWRQGARTWGRRGPRRAWRPRGRRGPRRRAAAGDPLTPSLGEEAAWRACGPRSEWASADGGGRRRRPRDRRALLGVWAVYCGPSATGDRSAFTFLGSSFLHGRGHGHVGVVRFLFRLPRRLRVERRV